MTVKIIDMNYKVILISFYLVSINLVSQEPLKFEEIVSVDTSVTAEMLFNRAQYWLVNIFENEGTLIKDENKQLICQAITYYESPIFAGSGIASNNIVYRLEIYFKKGRYKYVFKDFIHQGRFGLLTESEEFPRKIPLQPKKWQNRNWTYMKNHVKNLIKALITSLKHDMSKETEIENDNW